MQQIKIFTHIYIFEVVKQTKICPVHLIAFGSVAHNNFYGVKLILDSKKLHIAMVLKYFAGNIPVPKP